MAQNQTSNISSVISGIPALPFEREKVIAALNSTTKKIIKEVNVLLLGIIEKLKTLRSAAPASVGYSQRPTFSPIRRKKMIRVYGAIAIVLLLVGSFLLGRATSGNTNSTYADSRPTGPSIQAEEKLNKDFSFPLLDDKGAKVSTIKYRITNVALEDSIIVNGQRATAVKGRTFLVVNLEITNNHTQGIQINSRDYLRLQTSSSSDWIAPDIHNDPVTVQAISTKITRLGFPINDTDKNLTLQVGEIKGDKQLIKLNLERK